MGIFGKTKFIKTIAIILVFLTLFNFIMPKTVYAGWIDDFVEDVTHAINEALFNLLKSAMIGVANLFFWLFDGIACLLDELFCDTSLAKTASLNGMKYVDVNGDGKGQPDEPLDSTSNDGKIRFTPANIILGKFALLNGNIFHEYTDAEKVNFFDLDTNKDAKNDLRENVAAWYYALRNFSIVALLSVLVYVAIRMVISSVSADKAKYKLMLKDWLVALCLVIFMHLIMISLLEISTLITKSVGGSSGGYDINNCRYKIIKYIEKANNVNYKRSSGLWGSVGSLWDPLGNVFINIFLEIAMIVFTLLYAVKYMLRAITIMFLTIIGPVTAVTYPIDKISDGKAQAYNYWFKEYLYNAIIQPFHLLIFIVLIGSAAALAENNFLYCLVCLGAIYPSEKIVKQMFGLKNQTGGGDMADIAKTAITMSGMKKLAGGSGKHREIGKKNNDDSNSEDRELPPSQRDNEHLEAYDDGDSSSDSQSSSQQQLPSGDDSADSTSNDTTSTEREVGSSSESSNSNSESSQETTSSSQEQSKAEMELARKKELAKKLRDKMREREKARATETDGIIKDSNGGDFTDEQQSRMDEIASGHDIDREKLKRIDAMNLDAPKSSPATQEKSETEGSETPRTTAEESQEQTDGSETPRTTAEESQEQTDGSQTPRTTAEEPQEQTEGSQTPRTTAEQPQESNKGENKPSNTQRTSSGEKQATKLNPGQQRRRAIRNAIAKDVRKKFGTTSGKKLAGKAFKKVAGTATRLLAKGAGAALGAGIGLAATIATGDLSTITTGMAAGAGFMGDIGEKVDRGTKKVAGKVFEYANVGRKAAKAAKKGTDYRREASKSAFMQNQSERDHATQRLMDKSGGIIPTKAEVNEEMEKRWELRERGIRDNEVIDGALALSEEKVDNQLALEAGTDPEFATVQDALENDSQYAKDYAKLQKYNEEKEERGLLGAPGDVKDEFDKKYAKYGGSAAAEKHQDKKEKVEKRTMDQTAIAARIASEYSKADFKDEKKMSALQKTMSKEYSQQTGSSPEHSKKVVNRAITDAAKVKGVKAPNIPEEKTKEEKPKNEGKPKNEEKK